MSTQQGRPASQPPNTRVGIPVAALLVLLAAIAGGLLWAAVAGQDRVAREASQSIARAAFGAEAEALESTVRDYSWWSESVENMVFDFDPRWATEYIAAWLNDNFDVSRTFVFGPDQEPLHATLEAEPIGTDAPAWRVAGLRDLVGHVRARPDDPALSASAYVAFADGIHLVAASKLLLEAGASDRPPYPDKAVLAVTRRIDAGLLDQVERDFQLPGLALRPEGPVDDGRAALALPGPDGIPVAHVSWRSPRPGQRLLAWVLAPLGMAFAVVATLIGLILVRARRANRALVEAFEAQASAQAELEYMAHHDLLTGLPNRALFLQHLETAIAQSARNGSGFAVHYLDLDGFKRVNDTLGHRAGDDLLRATAVRLSGSVRAADTIARFGGDEFAILQRDCGDADEARVLARRVMQSLEEPLEIEGHGVRVSVSGGIAFNAAGADAEALLARADRALYRAKDGGGHAFHFHDGDGDTGGPPTSGGARGPGTA